MKRKGFTLVELLAVIAILAILIIIALPNVLRMFRKSKKDAFLVECKEIINTAKQQWFNEATHETKPKLYSKCKDGSCYEVLDMSGRDNIEYYILLNLKGEVVKAYITDGEFQYLEGDAGILNNINGEDPDELVEDVQEVVNLNEHEIITIKDNKVIVNDQVVTDDTVLPQKYKCVRGKSLHTEECTQSKDFCRGAGYTATGKMKTTTITYGQKGTRGKLEAGDVFDCDVNGDRQYDANNERFYFLSYYYDPNTKSFNNDYVVLLYYNMVSGGNPSNSIAAYDSANDNAKGPRTAYVELPSTSQWSNVRLKNTKRQILAEEKGNHDKTKTTFGDELPIFDYAGKSARLPAAREIFTKCGKYREAANVKTDELIDCIFLFENTKFGSNSKSAHGFWAESPRYGKGSNGTKDVNTITSTFRDWNVYRANNQAHDGQKHGVKPVIEVKISEIEF